nr:glycosyltransferase family 39 protein [Cohnella faecalis]
MKLLAKYKLDIPLTFIALLAAFLNGYDIWTDKYVNTYYTTAVAAMMQSWHNFFFASLDSAGSVTVDKPPVTFWIQTLSADLFGLHGWSVILPQALAGVGSVLLVYKLVKPTFGLAAARIGALAMACTPIAAAVSRTNNIDSMLVFALLVGVALLFRGVRKGSIWSVLGAFAMVGVGFNMKMLQAFMVLPAFYLFYLLAAKWGWKKKTGILAGATAVLLVVSLSWAVVVDSIPADKRPYIGSSGTNSVLNLAFGYNGVSRLTGDRSTGGGGARDGGFSGAPGGFMGQVGQGGQYGMDGQADGGGQPSGAVQSDGRQPDDGGGTNDNGGNVGTPGSDGNAAAAPDGNFRQDGNGGRGNGGFDGEVRTAASEETATEAVVRTAAEAGACSARERRARFACSSRAYPIKRAGSYRSRLSERSGCWQACAGGTGPPSSGKRCSGSLGCFR